jgi:integrase
MVKSRRDFLSAVGLLFKDAATRGIVPQNFNPARTVKRGQVKGSEIEVFTPGQLQLLLNSVDDSLKPFLAIWALSGIRKEEVSRLSWPQLDQALESGSIYLPASLTKTGEPRSVPVCVALKQWLMKYRQASGPVLPVQWRSSDAVKQLRLLDDMARHLARKAKLKWIRNGLRHSFCTFHLKLHGDPLLTARIAGNSLAKLQRHYVSRADSVTKVLAEAWFDVMPPAEAGGNVVEINPQSRAA